MQCPRGQQDNLPGDRVGRRRSIHDKVMVLPIWQLALLKGVAPRVAESGFGLIADYPWSAVDVIDYLRRHAA